MLLLWGLRGAHHYDYGRDETGGGRRRESTSWLQGRSGMSTYKWLVVVECGAELSKAVARKEVAARNEYQHDRALLDVLLELRYVIKIVDVEEDPQRRSLAAREQRLQPPLDDGHLILPRGPRMREKEVIRVPVRKGKLGYPCRAAQFDGVPWTDDEPGILQCSGGGRHAGKRARAIALFAMCLPRGSVARTVRKSGSRTARRAAPRSLSTSRQL